MIKQNIGKEKIERKILIIYPDGLLKEGWVIEETVNFVHARLGSKQSFMTQWLNRNQCEEIL